MNAFREKALWENNQRLICQKDILQRQLAEIAETRKNIRELEAIEQSLHGFKQMAGLRFSDNRTHFKSLSPDHSVAELLAIKIKKEAANLKGIEFDSYFDSTFNWRFITLGIYPNGEVYAMYSDKGFSSLDKVFGIEEAK